MMQGYAGIGWWMLVCVVIFLVVWISSIAVVVWAVRAFLANRRQTPALDDTLDTCATKHTRGREPQWAD